MASLLNDMMIPAHGHSHDLRNNGKNDAGSPVIAKAVAMCVLFLASFIIGCIPIKLASMFKWDGNPKNKIVVQMLLNFGGGVLLCTTFMHLLPEVAESVENLQAQGHLPDMSMHFAEFLMCVGFFTMYLVEEIVHYYLHNRQQKHEENTLKRNLSIKSSRNITMTSSSTTELVKAMDENVTTTNTKNGNPLQFTSTTEKDPHMNHNHHHHHNHQHHHDHQQDDHAGHSHIIINVEDSIVQNLRGLLVVLALSVHELFEGLAVGLESSASNVWYMFGAVSAHKLVIAFCIGVELVSTKTKNALVIIYVFMFAIVSPMGIGIGIFVSDDDSTSTTIASVILQGLASGTLLYVVFFEILQKEHRRGLKQYFSIVAGFALMFAMTFIAGHDHGHGEEHEIPQHSHAGPELFGSPANLTDGTNLF